MILPLLDDVSEENVERRISSDLQLAALYALGVAEFCGQPEIREWFALLPEKIFDISHLDRLANLAWTAWHIKNKVLSSQSHDSGPMLPADLIDRSTERKQRMLRVVEYYLSDHETAGPDIASIRSGTGYRDHASDLTRLATLYDEHKGVLKNDKMHYRATEASEARADAAEIMRYLSGGEDGPAAVWLNRQARIWHLLRTSYNEVAMAGRYLLRNDSRRERFGSLVTAGRRPARPAERPAAPAEPERELPAAEGSSAGSAE